MQRCGLSSRRRWRGRRGRRPPRHGRASGRRSRRRAGRARAVVSPLPRRMTSGISRGSEHEGAGAVAVGASGRGRPRPAAGRCPLERRAQDLVDEDGDGAQRGAARPQHGGVEALQQLARHVESDVRPCLEVRADGPDRDPPLAHVEPVRQRPATRSRDRAGRMAAMRRPARRARRPGRPSRRRRSSVPSSSRPGRLLDVRLVGGEELSPALTDERGRSRQRGVDGLVAQVRRGETRLRRLLPDELEQFHRASGWLIGTCRSRVAGRAPTRSSGRYTPPRERATSRSHREGQREPARRSPGNLPR